MKINKLFFSSLRKCTVFLCLFSLSFAEEEAPIQEHVSQPEISKTEEKKGNLPQFLFFKEITKQEYDRGIQLMSKLEDLIQADKLLKKKDCSKEIHFMKNEFIPFIRSLKTVDEEEVEIQIRITQGLLYLILQLDSSRKESEDIVKLQNWIENQKLERFGVLSFKNITKEQYDRGLKLIAKYFDIIHDIDRFAQQTQYIEAINYIKNECIPFVRSPKPANEAEKKLQMNVLKSFKKKISIFEYLEKKAPIQENIAEQEVQKTDEQKDDLPQFLFFKEVTKQEYDQGIQLMSKLKDLIQADKLLKKKDYSEEISFIKSEFIPFIRSLKIVDEKEAKIRIRTLHKLLSYVFRLDPSQKKTKDVIEVQDWIEKQGLERFAVISFKNITKEQYDCGVRLSIRYYNIINNLNELAKQKRQFIEEINFVKNECIPFVRSLKPANEEEKKLQMDTLESFETRISIFEIIEKNANEKK